MKIFREKKEEENWMHFLSDHNNRSLILWNVLDEWTAESDSGSDTETKTWLFLSLSEKRWKKCPSEWNKEWLEYTEFTITANFLLHDKWTNKQKYLGSCVPAESPSLHRAATSCQNTDQTARASLATGKRGKSLNYHSQTSNFYNNIRVIP